jgi:hypothetical protein
LRTSLAKGLLVATGDSGLVVSTVEFIWFFSISITPADC